MIVEVTYKPVPGVPVPPKTETFECESYEVNEQYLLFYKVVTAKGKEVASIVGGVPLTDNVQSWRVK